ncbi:butyrophilin-like protein 8 [Astatotilapia calliptera]|uniref:butyrophilin-like protein 8 n=1 Tax=Astatotilapia calliptera TaxID=8154 RepID=UPI000E3F9769|nr:butyrophilin-like protein 8 [Astatotilapia calliptera]
MSAVTASLCSTLLFFGIFVFVSADQKNITAQSGQNVTLTCRAPKNNIILGVEWNRADLRDGYVLFYRNEQLDPDNQHPSFKNRVDLQDRQMRDGDVSLILKNVTINDNGTYECRVKTGSNRRKRAILDGEPISIITLSVVDPPGQTGGDTEDGGKEDGGKEDGSVGLIAGLSVSAVFVTIAVGCFLIYKKGQPKHRQNSCQQTDDLQHVNGSVTHTESEKPALLNQTEG